MEYIKLDEQNHKTEVLLNCSEDCIKVEKQGEILFARGYVNGNLAKNGTSHTKDLTGGNGYEQ